VVVREFYDPLDGELGLDVEWVEDLLAFRLVDDEKKRKKKVLSLKVDHKFERWKRLVLDDLRTLSWRFSSLDRSFDFHSRTQNELRVVRR